MLEKESPITAPETQTKRGSVAHWVDHS